MKFVLLVNLCSAAPIWIDQLATLKTKRSLADNAVPVSIRANTTVLDSLDDLNRSYNVIPLNHTDINYEGLAPYLKEQVDKYETNQFRAEAYGDPHFVIEQDNRKVCFDLYGDQNNEITLLEDARSGLKVWGTVKKRSTSQTIVFDQIHIVTPKGAHITSDGRETTVSGTNFAASRVRDFELAQSTNQVSLQISIGRFSKIKMQISTARHLTVSFVELKSINNRVSGIIGEFYRQQFSIEETEDGKTGSFTFGGFKMPVEQVRNGRRKNCWFLSPYQIRQLFGFKY